MIEGDSGEYEYLTEAVELSKDVEGACCEVGNRMGMGLKTIIDAVRIYSPHKVVVGIDPYGHIPYIGRENDGAVRLDYTNDMKIKAMRDLWQYVSENPVNFIPLCLTDTDFFDIYKNGIPVYDLERTIVNKYSVVHFDGPHTVESILCELNFFHFRSDKGACYVFDDISPDFYDHSKVDEVLMNLQYKLIKQGYKKALYQKQ